MDSIPKPDSIIGLGPIMRETFDTLKQVFNVGEIYILHLEDVESANNHLRNVTDVAVFTMRKVQAVHYLATPGVGTTLDVLVGLVSELYRSVEELANHLALHGDAHGRACGERLTHLAYETLQAVVRVAASLLDTPHVRLV